MDIVGRREEERRGGGARDEKRMQGRCGRVRWEARGWGGGGKRGVRER